MSLLYKPKEEQTLTCDIKQESNKVRIKTLVAIVENTELMKC